MVYKNRDFDILLKKISPRLKAIARRMNGHGRYIDGKDLYQEMIVHLWVKFSNGKPDGINEAYIVRSCKFHISNYLRVVRDKAHFVSMETPIDEDGNTLMDLLPDGRISTDERVDNRLNIERIRKAGLSRREKEVFSLLLKGYTVREAGEKLGVSHVRIVRIKKHIADKCHRRF